MIAVTFNSAPAYLLDDSPDWNGGLQLDASIPSKTTRGISGREDRRVTGDTLRLSLKYSCTVQGAAVTTLRNSLQGLNAQPVLCPLWPYYFDIGATPTINASYYVLMGDDSAPEIKTFADLPFSRPAYPLLVGRLEDIPDPGALTDELELIVIKFVENDDSSIAPAAYTPPTGLAAASGTRPLFPWRPDWATQPISGGSEVAVERRNIGESRSTSDAYYSQRSRRKTTQSFTLESTDCWNVLRFFLDMGGMRQSFWLPASISEARLTANVGSGDTALTVDSPTARGSNVYVILDDLTNRTPLKLTGTSGSTWTLPGAVGQAYTKTQTRIESLFLARFDTASISLRWENTILVTLQLSFQELPWEVATVSGETIGTTQGALPTCAYLYVFTIKYPGATQTYRYTGFERLLNDGTHDYTEAPIEHDDITETATIERQSVNIKTRNFVGNPVALMIPFQLEWPLLLDIYEADVSGSTASNLRALFSGEVKSAAPDGPFWNITALSMSHVLDWDIPRFLIQPICNLNLFETRCGLAQSDWNWRGLLTTIDAGKLNLSINTVARVSGGAVTLVQHFFAGGFIYVGTGANVQYRTIADSAAASGTTIVLNLSSALNVAPSVGDTINFFPGCDGRKETCINRFNNYTNFLGFPFIPVGNPTALTVQSPGAGGKK